LARWGLLLVAVTFAAVALVLVGQVVSHFGAKIPGLYYLFAACDPPAVVGAWMAAIGSHRTTSPARAGGLAFFSAAGALTVVAAVVLGDLVLGRLAAGSGLHIALGSKIAWLAADAGTVLGLGGLALGARAVVACAGGAWPRWADASLALLLSCRGGAAIWGQLGDVPWPFRLAEAFLYAVVAWACAAASSSCRVTTSVRP